MNGEQPIHQPSAGCCIASTGCNIDSKPLKESPAPKPQKELLIGLHGAPAA